MSTKQINITTLKYAPWFLIIFHVIGLGIMMTPDRILGLSGLNMLVCSVLVLLSAQNLKNELVLLTFIYMGGMLIEILGVSTGILFGSYKYGAELGLKIMGVPLVLGLNWYCIVVASSNIALHFIPKQSMFLKAFVAAAACTFLDFFIEPVAIANDFWNWDGGSVPVFNYVCWFVFSLIFSVAYLAKTDKVNNTAIALFFIWFLFFTILNIV